MAGEYLEVEPSFKVLEGVGCAHVALPKMVGVV
jgi:hypothetical protein